MDNKRTFHFKLGEFDCISISDGTLPVPDLKPGSMRTQFDQSPGQSLEIMCLLIRTGKHLVLIDTGFGLMGQPAAGKLIRNLQAEGISCDKIETILISHLHPDHIGGNTDDTGRSLFPNARYLVYRKEWEYWNSNPDISQFNLKVQKDYLESIQKRVFPIRSQFDPIDEDTAILPGIKILPAPGHTPGQILITISSGHEQLLCVSDIFHDPAELSGPGQEMLGDSLPRIASLTRVQILSQLIKPDTLVYACHFPFPGLGHILKKGDSWYWQPVA